MVSIFAITTRGLEKVCEQEMRTISGISISQVTYRRIQASVEKLTPELLRLRTVDDIFLHLSTWKDILPQRQTLTDIRMHSTRLDLLDALAKIGEIRPLPKRPRFSITSSFVGKRNYSNEEIKQAIKQGITSRFAWEYLEDEGSSDINLRLFIDHEFAYAGMRLGKQSLQKREYKLVHTLGSLKPPVAASLLSLGVHHQKHVIDPFCGAGTIVIEAGLMGLSCLGGDIDSVALHAAHTNSLRAGLAPKLALWNSRHLPIANSSVELVVSNLPWGRQVITSPDLQRLYEQAYREILRILVPGGQAILLTSLPDWVKDENGKISQRIEISLFGQNPTILVISN